MGLSAKSSYSSLKEPLHAQPAYTNSMRLPAPGTAPACILLLRFGTFSMSAAAAAALAAKLAQIPLGDGLHALALPLA
jgi:hypothetical protein